MSSFSGKRKLGLVGVERLGAVQNLHAGRYVFVISRPCATLSKAEQDPWKALAQEHFSDYHRMLKQTAKDCMSPTGRIWSYHYVYGILGGPRPGELHEQRQREAAVQKLNDQQFVRSINCIVSWQAIV